MLYSKLLSLFFILFILFFILLPVNANAENFLSIPFMFNPSLIQGWIYNNGNMHGAIDYYCDTGEPIYAADSGVAMQAVQKINSTYSYGKYVFIKYDNNYASLYAHFDIVSDNIKFYNNNKRHNVNYSEWTRVNKGDYLGNCGMTGSDNTHLHFEVTNGKYATGRVDPYDLYMKKGAYYPNSSDIGVGVDSLWKDIPPDYIHEEIKDEIFSKPIEQKKSIFQKLSSFFTSLFTQDATDFTLGDKIEEKKKEEVTYIDAQIVDKNQNIYAEPGAVVEVVVHAKNTGSSVWQQKGMSINVAGGEYKNRMYKHESWLTNLRTTLLDQASVGTEQEGSFTFNLVMPDEIGDYEFQAMIVRQQGYSFTWVGHDMLTIQLHVGQKKPVVIEEVIEDDDVVQDLGEKVKQGIKGIKETTESIVDDIIEQIKKVPTYFGGGGGGTSAPVVSEDIVEEISSPDIIILFPTSTSYTTTTTSTIIFGSYNDDTQHVWVNGAMGDDMAYDNENKLWYFTTDLDIATNTFSFVGWNDDFSASSSAYELSIMREEEIEEIEIMLPEMTVTTPSTTPWIVTSTDFIFSGIFNSSTNNILVNSTTTSDLDMNTSTSIWTLPVTVSSTTSTYDFVAIDVLDNMSATTSVVLILEEEEIVDTEGPEMIMLSATTTDVGVTWTYMATDTLSDVVSYDISFSVAPDSSYNDAVCGGDTVWYETDDIAVLAVAYDFYALLDISSCILFTTTTSDTQLDIVLDDAHELLIFDMSVLATDSVGNSGDVLNVVYQWSVGTSDNVVEGDVVISEIAWMGTEASFNDEWFEICNIDDEVIDMSNWYISWGTNTTTISNLLLASNDCMVFERTDQTTISDYDVSYIYMGGFDNTGEHIILYSSLDTIMDEVDASDGWFVGDNDTKDTMIRINPTIAGNTSDNWCSFSSCPSASMRGTQDGVDADGNDISGSVGNWEVSYNAY